MVVGGSLRSPHHHRNATSSPPPIPLAARASFELSLAPLPPGPAATSPARQPHVGLPDLCTSPTEYAVTGLAAPRDVSSGHAMTTPTRLAVT